MAFKVPFSKDTLQLGSGELWDAANIVLTFNDYSPNITNGHFVTTVPSNSDPMGKIEEIKGDTTSIIGVSLRDLANLDQKSWKKQIEVCNKGLVTVEASGTIPKTGDPIYVYNKGDNIGKAAASSGSNTIEAKAEFIKEIQTNVWLINLK